MANKYSFTELQRAANENRRIGMYEGVEVYAKSKFNYDPAIHSKYYYVIYDDGNKMVRGLTVHGTIDTKGLLDVWKVKGVWESPYAKEAKKKAAEKIGKSQTYQVPATAYSAVVAQAEGNKVGEPISSDSWFSKLDREISELLSSAKTTEYDVFVAGYEVAVK
jgi:hypothetical protein